MSSRRNTRGKGLMMAFYGDDFTGSTDALEFLSRAGARTMLFMKPPTPEVLARYPGLDAVGIAGTTRSMAPAEIEETLKPAFTALNRLPVPHVHYKVCSTFDSSPERGSIGKAIDIGQAIFSPVFIPLLVAAPALGRYCLFGNLFARMGTGQEGRVYRLDRHPSMSRHPVTPADESDLLIHLSRQTSKKSGLLDVLQLTGSHDQALAAIERLRREGTEIILFDALNEAQLPGIGALLDNYAACSGNNLASESQDAGDNASQPESEFTVRKLFSVGSSGIEMALGAFWASQGRLPAAPSWPRSERAAPMLVVSGSCSPVTREQIGQAQRQGFQELELGSDLFQPGAQADIPSGTELKYAGRIESLLKAGKNVILHTGGELRSQPEKLPFGKVLGRITRTVLEAYPLKRMVVAGGDTSGEVAGELGIEALEMIAPLTPGAPLCRVYAPGSAADGLELSFKGGQVGRPDFFETALEGRGPDEWPAAIAPDPAT